MSGQQVSFTVVIPTHNGRTSVRAAVESVLAQTHPHFELIVVSDGEGSRTRDLLKEVTDPRLKIVEQAKKGVSAARNLGVATGASEWVAFLDDDDTVRDDWLQFWASQVAPNVAVVTARLAFWSAGKQTCVRQCRLAVDDPSMSASSILPGAFVIRRDLFTAVHGFDERLTYSENQDLGLRVCDHLNKDNPHLLVVNRNKIVADFNREAASSRASRYRSAPADSARIFLDRYAERLKHDHPGAASLNRIISRSERIDGHAGAAVSSALRAVKLNPKDSQNFRALLIALVNGTANLSRRLPRRWWANAWSSDLTRR